MRKLALAAGTLYLVTHVTSIAALALYRAGTDTQIRLGALLEVILALAIVGTAVTLYPVAKRHNEAVALGYVGLRTLEAAVIGVGIVSILAVVTARQQSVVPQAIHDWTFLVGPNLVCGANTVLMAYVMYKSRLVPRFIGVLGLIGGPLIFASAVAELFGLYQQVSAWGAITAIPVFAWELTLAFWLILKGFRPSALALLATPAALELVKNGA
jgi:hypothetical protein